MAHFAKAVTLRGPAHQNGEVQKMGGGRWDTSSLIRRLGKN